MGLTTAPEVRGVGGGGGAGSCDLALLDVADALGIVADRLGDRDRELVEDVEAVEAGQGGGGGERGEGGSGGTETLGPLPLPPSQQSSPVVGWGVGWGVWRRGEGAVSRRRGHKAVMGCVMGLSAQSS